MSKIRDETKKIENKSIPNGLNGNSKIVSKKLKNKMATDDLSKDKTVDKESLSDCKDALSSEVPTANGRLSPLVNSVNGDHDSQDSHSSKKSINKECKSSQKLIGDEKVDDNNEKKDKNEQLGDKNKKLGDKNEKINDDEKIVDKKDKNEKIDDKKEKNDEKNEKVDNKNEEESEKSNPKISHDKTSNSKSSDLTVDNKDATSGKLSNENSKTNSSDLEKDAEKVSSSNISDEKPLENGEVSSKETSTPDSPLSHVLSDLDLEESLLRDDMLANVDQDDFCEDKLLEEIDEDALLKEKNTDEEDPLSSKSVSMSDVTKPIAEENEKSSDCDRQDKEIQKILKNLNSSIGNHGNSSSSSSSSKIKKSKVESSETSNNSSVDKSVSKLSDNSPSLTESNSSLPGNSSTKTSGKRSYSTDKKSNSDSSNKLQKINEGSRESANNVSKTVDKTKLESKEKKETANSSTKSNNKNAITFSEALKSIAMESKNSSLLSMNDPQPLVPITEISSDITPSSTNLTVLGAMDTRTQTVDTIVKSPSSGDFVDMDTEKQGVLPTTVEDDEVQVRRASSEGNEGQVGKKRPLSEGSDTGGPKPDLKKIRVFRNEDAAKKMTDEDELCKSIDQAQSLKSHLQEEKASKESNKTTTTTEQSLEIDGLICIDQEDIQRKTVNELKKANLTNNKFKRIKRKDLEGLVIELFVDKVLYEHQLGQQKDLCKRLEATLEGNRKKAAQFHKEIEDLKKVTQRLQAEHAVRKGQVIAPVKVKRSVGIQATPTIISKGVMHASSYGNIRVLSPSANSSSASGLTNPGTITPINRAVGGNQMLQPGSLVSTQPLPFANSQGSGGQMVVVNPVVMQQTQNAGTGSPVGPVGAGTRVIRTPLTPIAQSNLATTTPGALLSASGSSSNSSLSGLIDLTDDDDGKSKLSKTQRTTLQPGSLVAIQRSPANSQGTSGQFVLNPPTSVGQLVLVPSSTGQTTTALVVGSVANSTQPLSTGVVRSAALNQNTSVRFSSNIINTTRVAVVGPNQLNGSNFVAQIPHHPAPLPRAPPQQTSGYSKKLPPVPILKLSHKDNSIVLSWNMAKTDEHERVASYQLYAYQEGTAPPTPALWKKVGSVKALELPMACTLTQFMPGHVYHFAVRAVDIRSRLGPFSEPRSIRLGSNK